MYGIASTPILVNEDGSVELSGGLSTGEQLRLLSEELSLFLLRLETCDRDEEGAYLLRDRRVGVLGGFEVQWNKILALSTLISTTTFKPLTPEQRAHFEQTGLLACRVESTRNERPLADTMIQLLFAVLYDGTDMPARLDVKSTERIERLARVVDHLVLTQRPAHSSAASEVPAVASEFWPATSFPKSVAKRLRMASRPERQTKRVGKRIEGGVTLYSVDDARLWWPKDMNSDT